MSKLLKLLLAATLSFVSFSANADSGNIRNSGNLIVGAVNIVGAENINIGYGDPFPWIGNLADLGKLPGYDNIYPVAMDGLGQVVGSSSTSDNQTYIATLWNNGVPTDLNSFLDTGSISTGWTLVNATGIMSFLIVGDAFNNHLNQNGSFVNFFGQVFISPVPEADTSAMLLMGAGLMGFMARRRKNNQV